MTDSQIFAGLRALDFSEGMAGPLATMLMADGGADVVKVEPPDGDWCRDRPGFRMWNRGKRSVTLDLHAAEDRARALELAAGADVVVQAWRPGVATALGLDPQTLRIGRPELICGTITGFGPAAAFDEVEGYEGVVSAASGSMLGRDAVSGAAVGTRRDRPIFAASPILSYGSAQLLFQGITAALFDRNRTGEGEHVQTSLLQAACALHMRNGLRRDGQTVVSPLSGPVDMARLGVDLAFLTVECSDGRWIQMCARQDEHFRRWLHAVGLGHLLEEEAYRKAPLAIRSPEDVRILEQLLRQQMRTRTQEEWISLFAGEFDVGADPFLTPAEFIGHEQLIANDRVVEVVDDEVGVTKQMGPLVLLSETPLSITTGAPRLPRRGDLCAWRVTETSGSAPRSTSKSGAGAGKAAAPLSGVTVLDVAYYLAAPLSATVLAEMGARVIKVEPITGDPYRRSGLEYCPLGAGKESIGVDLKSAEGQAIVHRLVKGADALVHSFRPGVPQRLGLDYETVRALNPRLVYLYGGSYGSKGPQSHRPAMHSTPHALTGGGILQAGLGNPPVDDSYPDPVAGLAAASGLLMGLWSRERTGRGQYLETTMIASSGFVHSDRLTFHDGRADDFVVDGGQHGYEATYRLYECAAGWLFVAVVQQPEWEALCAVLGQEGLAADPRFATPKDRRAHSEELTKLLGEVFTTASADTWQERLLAAGVPAVRADTNPFPDFLLAHGLLVAEEHPSFGPYWRMPAKVTFDRRPNTLKPASRLGEYTEPILRELGYEPADIAEMFAAGVVC